MAAAEKLLKKIEAEQAERGFKQPEPAITPNPRVLETPEERRERVHADIPKDFPVEAETPEQKRRVSTANAVQAYMEKQGKTHPVANPATEEPKEYDPERHAHALWRDEGFPVEKKPTHPEAAYMRHVCELLINQARHDRDMVPTEIVSRKTIIDSEWRDFIRLLPAFKQHLTDLGKTPLQACIEWCHEQGITGDGASRTAETETSAEVAAPVRGLSEGPVDLAGAGAPGAADGTERVEV